MRYLQKLLYLDQRECFMKKLVYIAAILLLLPVMGICSTEEIVSEGTYNMGDAESPSVAEARALLNAKRNALEQAGTYVKSYSKVRNMVLTEDEVEVLAAGIMEVTILDKKRSVVGDGFHFWVKINAKINTLKVEELAKQVKERSIIEDYKRIKAEHEANKGEIERLKKELARAKGAEEKKGIEATISKEEKKFQLNEMLGKANVHCINKEYDKALEIYNAAISMDPGFAPSYFSRADIYEMKGQSSLAIEDYTRFISMSPSHAFLAYLNRGNIYMKDRRYDKALDDYSKAIAMSPDHFFLYVNRGRLYVKMGRYDKAIEDYNKALTLDSGGSQESIYVNRGYAYTAMGQYDKAMQDYGKAITLKPEGTEAYYQRGNLYRFRRQFDRAIVDYTKAIGIHPTADTYFRRGAAYHGIGENDKAFEDFNKVISLDPKHAKAYLGLASLYGKKGQHLKEIENYSQAIAVNTDESLQRALYLFRAHTFYQIRDFDRALSDYERACNMGSADGCKGAKNMRILNRR
jgi:tetratricopeptide (TPR) repeat protein